MKIVPLNQTGMHANWFPLSTDYKHDQTVELKRDSVSSGENLTLMLSEAFLNPNACEVNNHSALMLTSPETIQDFARLKLPIKESRVSFTTTLLMNDNDPHYLTIPDDYLNPTIIKPTQGQVKFIKPVQKKKNSVSITGHDSVFEVQIDVVDDKQYAQVFHESSRNNSTAVYTLMHANNVIGFYKINSRSEYRDNFHKLTNKFECLLDYESNTMVLIVPAYGNKQTSIVDPDVYNNKLNIREYKTVDDFADPNILIHFKHNRINSDRFQTQSFSSNWVTYQDKINTNHVNINESKTRSNVKNNFLLNSEFETVDNFSLSLDITPLKNQLTTDHDNVMIDAYRRRQGAVRDYDKLFTGSNETNGYDSITTGYTSYIESLELVPGKLTYFHVPRDMYPLKKLNINDSGLYDSGAIPGDNPLRSDKVFKKRAGYDNNTNHGVIEDEHAGKWLCSWLYRDPDKGKPIWVDRYYQPDLITSDQALRLPPVKSSITYNTQYSNRVKDVGSNQPVYDKISDLCFETGGLYAYYHLGSHDIDQIVNSISSHAIELSMYKLNDLDSLTNTPIDSASVIRFDESTKDYAIATVPKNREKKNSITISMTLSSADWSSEFGSVIIGNYVDRGINIINKRIISPIQLLRHESSIHVYNNNFDKINTIDVGTNNFKITETEYFQSLAVLVEESDELYLHRYSTLSPYIVTKHLLDDKWSERGTPLADVSVKSTPDKIYLLDDSNTGTYTYIDTVSLQMFTGLSAMYVQDMNKLTSVVYNATNILPLSDGVRVFDDMLTRIDGNGHVWFVKDNKLDIYRYDPELDLITGEVRLVKQGEVGFPMSVYFRGDEIVDIKLDQHNDLWILYKLNNRFRCCKISADRVNSAQKQVLVDIDLEPGEYTNLDGGWVYDDFLGLSYPVEQNPDSNTDMEQLAGNWVYSYSLGNKWIYRATDTNWYWFRDLEQWLYIASYNPTDTIYMDFTFDTDQDNIYFIYDGEYKTATPLYNTLVYSNKENKYVTGKEFLEWSTSKQPGDQLQWTTLSETFRQIEVGDQVNSLSDLIEYVTTSKPGSFIKKYTLSGEYISEKTITDELKISDLYKQDVSGLQFLLPAFYKYDRQNYLFAKCRLHNPVDFDDLTEVTLLTRVDQFDKGAHDLAVVGDSENGALSLYIDGVLRSQKRFDNLRYRFDELIDKTLYIGTSPGVRGLPLYENIKTQSGLDITNIAVYNLKAFNTSLYHYELEHLHRKHTGIKPITWHLPGGVRNYVDTIDKTLKQTQPTRKSNYFDIDIRTDTLSSTDVMRRITELLQQTISTYTPANMLPRNVTWSDPVPNESIKSIISQFDTYYYFKDCADYPELTPTPVPTLAPDPTPEPTPTPTPTPEPTPVEENLPTPFPTPTLEPTPTFVATPEPTPTLEPTPTPSPTPSITPTPTSTSTPTPTPVPSPTPTAIPLDPCAGFPHSVLIDAETVDDNELAFFRAPIGSRVCHFGASGGAGSATIVYLDGVPSFQITIAGTLLNNSIRYIDTSGTVYEGVINPVGETNLIS